MRTSFYESGAIMYEYRNAPSELVSLTKGRPSSVEFDWEAVRTYRKFLGKDFDPSRLHFWHVHPPGAYFYSELDIHCLDGFNVALNYPVRFSIIVFNSGTLVSPAFELDVDYKALHITFENGEVIKHEENDDFSLRLPRSVLTSMKTLCFGDNWQVDEGERV